MKFDNIELVTVGKMRGDELENFFKDKGEFLHKLNGFINDYQISSILNDSMAKVEKYEMASFEEKLLMREFIVETLKMVVKKMILERAYLETIKSRRPLLTNDSYLANILEKDVIYIIMREMVPYLEELIEEYDKFNQESLVEKFFKNLN